MMISDFQTQIAIPFFHKKTGYTGPALFMGSCFTENIGNRMSELKFPVDINPFGILYNPASVAKGLQFLVEKRIFTRDDLIHHNGLWHSFYHHGRFSSHDADNALIAINSRIEHSSNFIRTAEILFVTFGTAWIYEYKQTGITVTNCHKIPDKEFRRFRLSVDEIVDLVPTGSSPNLECEPKSAYCFYCESNPALERWCHRKSTKQIGIDTRGGTNHQ
jgi:hypothetical protein